MEFLFGWYRSFLLFMVISSAIAAAESSEKWEGPLEDVYKTVEVIDFQWHVPHIRFQRINDAGEMVLGYLSVATVSHEDARRYRRYCVDRSLENHPGWSIERMRDCVKKAHALKAQGCSKTLVTLRLSVSEKELRVCERFLQWADEKHPDPLLVEIGWLDFEKADPELAFALRQREFHIAKILTRIHNPRVSIYWGSHQLLKDYYKNGICATGGNVMSTHSTVYLHKNLVAHKEQWKKLSENITKNQHELFAPERCKMVSEALDNWALESAE